MISLMSSYNEVSIDHVVINVNILIFLFLLYLAPSMVSPHYGIIVTEEQIKIIHLPSLKLKRKEKVTNEIHERIKKAFIIRANVLGKSYAHVID